ncbi:MAG: TonB-dependent receptor [Pseudomonadales bacterium]
MIRYTTVLLSCALALFGAPSVLAADDDDTIEEVVVTGSYLKRSAQDSPSPLSVVTSADIEDIGAADVAEVIASMPWSSGSQTRAATFQGEGADGRANVNLRNLGHGATLPLVNGKRHVPSWYNPRGNASTNVNALVPNIAIERIEIVKDGASALYGSDAVAGVVNLLTKSEFEGFDFSYQYTVDDETGEGSANQVGMIWGVQGDRGGIVASASFLNRNEIRTDDNFGRFGGTTVSSTGQPGRLLPIAGQTITWAPHGAFPGDQVGANGETSLNNLPRNAAGTDFGQADVNCEDAVNVSPGRGGALGNIFNRCVYDYASFFAIQAEEGLRNMFVEGHYDLTDQLEAKFEFAATQSEFNRLNSLNPNAPALTIPTGTTYLDDMGMAVTVANPGSVEDAFRRGIEPVEYANLTRLQGYSANENGTALRPKKTFTDTNRNDQRLVFGLGYDFELGDNAWHIDATYTASNHSSQTSQVQDTLSTHMRAALNGYGGPNCDQVNGTPGDGNLTYATSGGDFAAGNCYFFNPFGNAHFDRSGNVGQSDLTLVNPAELYDWLIGRASSDTDYRQRVIDVVAAGDIFQMDAGGVGLAVGFQQRRDKGKVVLDSALTSDNLDFVFGADDWSGKLTTTAFFVEMNIPFTDWMEVNIAGRYEDFDEIGEDTVDPKVTVLIRPTDSLTIRASAGSSFRVPSLLQSFGALTTVANQVDVVGGTAFKPSITQGNPNLAPESADTWNIGLSWVPQDGPLEGLSIDLDYYDYDYTDIITRESSANIIAADNAVITAYAAANGLTLAEAAIDPASGRNFDQVIRNGSGIMVRLLPNFANANGAEVSGLDLNASYRFDTDIGNFRVGIQAAWIDTFEVEVPNSSGGATIIDGVGNYNSTNPVARPLPEWKVNGTIGWSKDNHRLFLMARWVDELETDVPFGTRFFFSSTAALAGNNSIARDLLDEEIEDMLTVDLQYNYNFGEFGFLNDTNLTIGAQNIFDEEAPAIAVVTAFDGTLHDGRGRIFFVRMSGSM